MRPIPPPVFNFDELVAVSTRTGMVMSQWAVPYEGKYKKPPGAPGRPLIQARLTPAVGPGGAGLVLSGTF